MLQRGRTPTPHLPEEQQREILLLQALFYRGINAIGRTEPSQSKCFLLGPISQDCCLRQEVTHRVLKGRKMFKTQHSQWVCLLSMRTSVGSFGLQEWTLNGPRIFAGSNGKAADGVTSSCGLVPCCAHSEAWLVAVQIHLWESWGGAIESTQERLIFTTHFLFLYQVPRASLK